MTASTSEGIQFAGCPGVKRPTFTRSRALERKLSEQLRRDTGRALSQRIAALLQGITVDIGGVPVAVRAANEAIAEHMEFLNDQPSAQRSPRLQLWVGDRLFGAFHAARSRSR